jgi:precorrin-6Y C5,15-methyltransferase (decarboxylating)
MAEPLAVVGMHGGRWFGDHATAALRHADVVLGAARHLQALPAEMAGEHLEWAGSLGELLEVVDERRRAGDRVVVLASGDPGFFGIGRVLAGRFGRHALALHPAPSSVALAFARVGLPWDDAVVVSCHGRPLADAVPVIAAAAKVAVLTSPDAPPEVVARALRHAGTKDRSAWVCSALGEVDETVAGGDLAAVAAGRWDPLSVLVLCAPGAEVAPTAGLAWGRPESAYRHRRSLITKAEVRAVALSKLELGGAAILWDVGAGSGSVAIEASRLAPGLRVYAVERHPGDCGRIRANAAGVAVTVVEGEAPACLADLPDPDRVFVGGGGLTVLDAALARLRPGGVAVATYATLASAVAAADRLGQLIQVQISRGAAIGPAGELRLEAENPVFVVWGQP